MKYLNLAVTVIAIHLLIPDTHGVITKRCQSVCSRSDGQDFCQRCRMRVPMRFGKRTDSSRSIDTKSAIRRITDDDEDDSRYDDPNPRPSSPSNSESIKAESEILLNSMRNFVRDLDEWNRDLYDQ